MTATSWSSRNAERVRQRKAPTDIPSGELRRSAETRTRILDAAISSLVTDGYHKLSVASVAERAGFTRAAAIYHFPSREALLEATVTSLFDRRLELYWEAVRDVPENADQIRVFVDAYWDQVKGDLFAAFTELLVASRTDPVLSAIMRPELDRYERERARYSQLIFTHAMREAAGDRFETIRAVTRFLIEGMAFAEAHIGITPEMIATIKAFAVAQMEAAYRR